MDTYNDEIAHAIDEILKEYEAKYNINIFFACDTGSRSLGVAVKTSDFDLNGFFIPHYKEYLKIQRTSKEIIAKQGIKFKVNDENYELDIQLWDIKDWLKEKIDKNVLGCDFCFESPIVFRNYHSDIIENIKSFIKPPFYLFWGKYRNNFDLCQKDIKKEGTQNKKIMNTLIYAIQYLHTRVLDGFPKYNIFEEMKIFIENKEKIIHKGQITEDEFKNLLECFEFIEVCYEEKKKSRKGLTKEIPQCVMYLNKMMLDKFQAKSMKIGIINYWNEKNCQEIFDKLLDVYKK
jgi:predicted nucleotidyltransferase